MMTKPISRAKYTPDELRLARNAYQAAWRAAHPESVKASREKFYAKMLDRMIQQNETTKTERND